MAMDASRLIPNNKELAKVYETASIAHTGLNKKIKDRIANEGISADSPKVGSLIEDAHKELKAIGFEMVDYVSDAHEGHEIDGFKARKADRAGTRAAWQHPGTGQIKEFDADPDTFDISTLRNTSPDYLDKGSGASEELYEKGRTAVRSGTRELTEERKAAQAVKEEENRKYQEQQNEIQRKETEKGKAHLERRKVERAELEGTKPSEMAASQPAPAAAAPAPSAIESAVESAAESAPEAKPAASKPAATSQPAAAPEKTLNRAQKKALEAQQKRAAAAAQASAAPAPSAIESAVESAAENAPEARPQAAAAGLEPAAAPQEAKLAQGAEEVAQAASTGAPIPQPVSAEKQPLEIRRDTQQEVDQRVQNWDNRTTNHPDWESATNDQKQYMGSQANLSELDDYEARGQKHPLLYTDDDWSELHSKEDEATRAHYAEHDKWARENRPAAERAVRAREYQREMEEQARNPSSAPTPDPDQKLYDDFEASQQRARGSDPDFYVDENGVTQEGRAARGASPNQNYYERLGYTDVGQHPKFVENFPNAQKYAAALDKADPDQVAETVSNIRGKYAQAAKAAGVEHWSDASESWALWDIGKQLHLNEEAQATGGASANPNYRNANPLTDAQLQDEIVARHLGFSSDPTPGVPSHELTRKGRALMDQHGIPHEMPSGPASKAGATASKGAKITTGAEAARTGANGMRTGSNSVASKALGGRGRRLNVDVVDRQLDLTTRGLAGSISSVINDYGLNRREAVGGGHMDTLFGKAIRTGGQRVSWSSAEYAAPVFNAAEKESKWATFATAQEAAESWGDEIEGRAAQGGYRNRARAAIYRGLGGRGSAANNMMAKIGGFGTALPVAFNLAAVGFGMKDGYREGGIGGAMKGGAKSLVANAVQGQVIGASLAHPLAMLGGASLMMASYKIGHGIFDVRTKGNNYLKMGRSGGLSWNTGSTPGMDSQVASTMRGRALMSMENSRFNAMKSLGNESYMMTSPSARYANSTQLGSQQPMLAY